MRHLGLRRRDGHIQRRQRVFVEQKLQPRETVTALSVFQFSTSWPFSYPNAHHPLLATITAAIKIPAPSAIRLKRRGSRSARGSRCVAPT